MSEQQTEAPETAATATTTEPEQQTKPAETVDFWKQKAREQEKRAKENAAAAQKLAEIEDAQRTDAERSASRIADLEAELGEARRDSLRFKVASKHGISDEDAEMFLTGSDEETLIRQAERLAAWNAEAAAPRAPKPDANQGRSQGNAPKSPADSFADFFRNNLPER